MVRNKNVTSRVHTEQISKHSCLTIFIISVMKIDLGHQILSPSPKKFLVVFPIYYIERDYSGFFDKDTLGQIDSRFLGKAATGRYARPH